MDVVLSKDPKTPPPPSTLVFGHTFVSQSIPTYLLANRTSFLPHLLKTDHMLAIPWHVDGGWGTPKIQPCECAPKHISQDVVHTPSDAPLPLSPSATVFHYAHCLFEGLKAYRDPSGKVTLFRPDMNMKRMNTSAERVAMPVCVLNVLR